MALRVPESKFWDHFYRPKPPPKPHLDHLGTQIGPRKVILGHFINFAYFYPVFPLARALFFKPVSSHENVDRFFSTFCAISVHKKAAKKHPAQGFGKNYLMTTHSTVHSRECMAGGALNYSSHLTFTKGKDNVLLNFCGIKTRRNGESLSRNRISDPRF